MGTVAVIGTFDSKGEEFGFLIGQIKRAGAQTLSIDIGTKGPAMFRPDISAEEVARAGGEDLDALRKTNDPARCMQAEAKGLPVLVGELLKQNRIQGVIAMGGGQGSSVLRNALRRSRRAFQRCWSRQWRGPGTNCSAGSRIRF